MDEKEKDALQHPQEPTAKVTKITDLLKNTIKEVSRTNANCLDANFTKEVYDSLNDFNHDVGVITIKSVNKMIEEAKKMPDPIPLYKSLWYENEICFLFADSGNGKTILAVQIAEEITRNDSDKRVIYFDFELSEKQFQKRYTNDNCTYRFSPNFYRADFSKDNYQELTDEQLVKNIEDAVKEASSDVVIIDNITILCQNLEKGRDAGSLMKSLKIMAQQNGWSLLIVAHTPKRDEYSVLTSNSMAGSKNLVNFADSVFTIGKCRKDDNLRYIKQVKTRAGEMEYGSENVLVCTLEKEDNAFLYFKIIGNSSETELLKCTDEERGKLKAKVRELANQGYSYRNIAQQLGISKSYVNKILKEKK